MGRSAPAGPRRVCMVAYYESPALIPPMFNTGVSLGAEGFEVEALCFAPTDGPEQVHAPGFRSRRFAIRTRGLGRGRSGRLVGALRYLLSYAEYVGRAFARAVKARAHVYEAHDLPALLPTVLAAKVLRRPVVYRAHELFSETHARVPFAWFWRLLDRALVPRCDEVVTPDPHRSRIYLQEFHARRAPLTIRNCPPFRPPLESTRLRDELRRRGIACDTIVLYQGLVSSMRCIEEIAEASRSFAAGVVLVILGPGFGDWADPAARLAHHAHVVVLPRVPYEELAAFTASADLGLLLYRNDCRNNYHCAPNKVFEYMMMGLPTVAAAFPGLEELVEGEGVGLCVDPEDPAAIAAAVNRLAADPELRRRMRERALRRSVERYNWELESRPLLERLRSLAAGGELDASGEEARARPGVAGG